MIMSTNDMIIKTATAPLPAFPKEFLKFGNKRLNVCAIIQRIFPNIKSVISSLFCLKLNPFKSLLNVDKFNVAKW